MDRPTGIAVLVVASVAAAAPAACAHGQTTQYRSPAGVEYRSQRDTGAIARAESLVAADPRNVERIIQLGLAQAGVRQYREAIATFTRGLAIAPNDPVLYRWRGHRYLSLREFDRAMGDFTRGARIDSTNYGIWYHFGIVRYARGDFAGAADAFARALARAPDAGERAGATDWLWMALSRAGRRAEAQALLDRRPDSLPASNAYAQRLRLYRGQTGPDDVSTAADTSDIAVATLSYGVGNWYLVRGDTARARAWFARSVTSGGWPAFGFIMSEVELRRLRPAVDRAAASPAAPRYTAADVHFMTGMIRHHAQAVLIAGWAPTHGASQSLQALCERIVVGQQDEIALAARWLRERNEDVPQTDALHDKMPGMDHAMLMPGMLTAEQLAQLDRARGAEFDRLFLTFMIQHHQGAITMVDQLFASQGGGEQEMVFRFASDVYADQTTEIDRMQKMLAALLFEGRSQ